MSNMSFSELGDANLIQQKLGVAIITDYKFSMQMADILDVKYFDLLAIRIVIDEYYKYHKVYKLFPPVDILYNIVKDRLEVKSNEIMYGLINEFFGKVRDDKFVGDAGMPYVKDKAIDFCRKQKILQAMILAQTKLNNSKYDEIEKILNEALNVGGERDIGLIYDEDIKSRIAELVTREPVTSGFAHLDEVIRGGFGQGELVVFIAPTGGGKTTFLVNLGVNALKAGKKVAHYTLELDEKLVGLRYDSNILGIPLEQFIEDGDAITDVNGKIKKVKRIKQSVGDELNNMKKKYFTETSKLVIKQYPSRRATVNVIRNHMFKMNMMDMKPNLILVDYADLLKPVVVRSEKRYELEELYSELRALAVEYKCPVITCSQTNREGWDEDVVTLKHISEAYAKATEVDLALCFSRTVADKPKGVARMLVAKNRNGKEGMFFPVRFLDNIYRMEVLQSCNWDELPDEFKCVNSRDIGKILKKYSSENKT